MLALPVLALGLAVGAPTVVSGSAPEPLAVLIATPTGETGQVSRSEVIRALDRAIDEATELSTVLVDPGVNKDCRGRLACIVNALTRKDSAIQWLLVFTQVTLPERPDRVSMTFVDAARGSSLVEGLSGADAEDELDTVSSRSEPSTIRNGADLDAYLTQAFRKDLHRPLARAGRLRARGEIRLGPTQPGALVHLDGRPLVTTTQEPTYIERVASGPREVLLTLGTSRWRAVVTVGEAPLELYPKLSGPGGGSSALRPALAIGGAVLAVAGSALTIAGAVSADPNVKTACLASRNGCVGGPSFVGFDYDPAAEDPDDVDSGSLGLAPMGGALAITGLGVAVGSLLEDGDGVPWWTLGLSILAGGAALGASVALDQGRLP